MQIPLNRMPIPIERHAVPLHAARSDAKDINDRIMRLGIYYICIDDFPL